jgi:plasmid stability protein
MPKQLTIRGVPDDIARKLDRLSRAQGHSVNATVLQILNGALGTAPRRARLARYATWTADDADQVEKAVAAQRVIDDTLWR